MRCIHAIGCLLAVCCASPCLAENHDPIVLVHGIAGWGREEMGGYLYWGGGFKDKAPERDIQQVLIKDGIQAYTAAVGPYSSNWDRAVELYYQIKGGCVDYGEAHAKAHSHLRSTKQKCYTGFYPEWDDNHKLHFVGHSQGGQTIRVLAALLENGDQKERTMSGDKVSGLFQGNKHWLRSITTVATPHNGTTLADVRNFLPFFSSIVDFIKKWAGLAAGIPLSPKFYDLKLEQWGMQKAETESMESYLRRVMTQDSTDFSFYDLSREGAQALNQRTPTSQDVYYFSFSTRATARWLGWGNECPTERMQGILWPTAVLISPCPSLSLDLLTHRAGWLANDGVVNTASMAAPEPLEPQAFDFSNQASPGVWQHLSLHQDLDHLYAVGMWFDGFRQPPPWNAPKFYLEHARFLRHAL